MLAGSLFAQVVAVIARMAPRRRPSLRRRLHRAFGRPLPGARLADPRRTSGAGWAETRKRAASCPGAPTPTSTCDS